MKKKLINIITSVSVVAALSLSIGITPAAAAGTATVTEANASDTLTAFEKRYDLTDTGLVIDKLDFSGVKEIKTAAEWETYVKACVDRGYHFVFFKPAQGLTVDLNSFMNKYGITYAVTHKITRSKVTYTGYEFTYPYATDILNAVKAGKESSLSEKHKKALEAARTFLAGLPEGISDYDKELAIHNYVCGAISYTQDRALENMTDCYGGLILGRGNCASYTDAFNLLCGLSGFETGRVMCTVESGLHTLNYILIDGDYYFVDCTFDDGISSDRGYGLFYFNLPYTTIAKSHALQDLPFTPSQTTTSDKGYYQHYGMFADSPDSLLQVYKKLASESTTGELLFDTSKGNASLIDMFQKYHPAGTSKISVSKTAIGNYQILKFSLN